MMGELKTKMEEQLELYENWRLQKEPKNKEQKKKKGGVMEEKITERQNKAEEEQGKWAYFDEDLVTEHEYTEIEWADLFVNMQSINYYCWGTSFHKRNQSFEEMKIRRLGIENFFKCALEEDMKMTRRSKIGYMRTPFKYDGMYNEGLKRKIALLKNLRDYQQPMSFDQKDDQPGKIFADALADMGLINDCLLYLEHQIQSLDKLIRCKVCLDSDACMVFFPCRHMATCEYCGSFLDQCPVCRAVIEETVKVNKKQ